MAAVITTPRQKVGWGSANVVVIARQQITVPWEERAHRDGASDRDIPADRARDPAVQHRALAWPVQHLAGADHPLHRVRLAAWHLHSVGFLPRDSVGAREGGQG